MSDKNRNIPKKINTKAKQPRRENRGPAVVFWTLLCVCCMAVMLSFAANKTIVIAEVSQEKPGLVMNAGPEGHSSQETALQLKMVYGIKDSFSIPLPESVKAENVVMENRCMDRELRIYIQSNEEIFYRENGVSGDVSSILSGCAESQEDGILLKLQMEHVMEYKSTMEGSVLTIECSEPEELYSFIVVLDPGSGGSNQGKKGENLTEKDLTLQVARLVQKKLTNPEIRIYLTRTEDVDISDADRAEFVESVGADAYIRLEAAEDGQNPENYGIQSSYNEDYIIPDLGNAGLADVVTRAVTIAASNRAAGLFSAEEGSILKMLKTRGCCISLGYLSNPKEEALLMRESYQEKLAEGIVNAIEEAYGLLNGSTGGK